MLCLRKKTLLVPIIIILIISIICSILNPFGILRALMLGFAVFLCFVVINYTRLSNIIRISICSLAILFTIGLEILIPQLNLNEMEFIDHKTKFFLMYIASPVKVMGYFITLLVAIYLFWFVLSKFRRQSEKQKKIYAGYAFIITGVLGGTLFSAINIPSYFIFYAVCGLVFSFFIYLSMFYLIYFNDLPGIINEENKEKKDLDKGEI